MLTRIRGTRDILDARPMHHIITIMSHYFQNACFVPIQLPTIEFCELFQKSLGQASDAVSKEMYLVKTIHENSENICLRPEFTASAMRAYLLERPELKPWKVFTYGSAFRHERPQKGLYREFYQFSIEIIEGLSYLYDVELLSLMSVLFKKVLGIIFFTKIL